MDDIPRKNNITHTMKAINYTYITFFSVVSILSSFPLLINPPLASAQSLSPITPTADNTGTIVHPQGDRWQIEGGSYNSDRTNLFHSFQRFNVPNGQTANFLATPQLKNILGRVTGGEASFINGLIQVTGGKANLFLMNPAGMIFGPNASLNIPAAFTATTATGIGFGNIWWQGIGTNNYENLLGSPNSFAFSLSQPGVIVNQANLAVNPGESINLFGGVVVNTGNLTATGGNITLTAVAGEQILRIAQNGHLLNLEVAPLSTVGQIPLGENITPLTLPALLTGNSQDHATTISVNNLGQVVLANHVLIPTQSGTVITAGKINVANPQGQGGNVTIFGDRTAVINSTINANGKDGGGTILIGGDWQGQGKFNAQQTFVNEQSVIKANAEDRGNGGKVVIWSDDTTKFAGEITATGGKQAGDGGLVEISGKQDLVFRGKVDVGAINGQIGNILFDPENIVIDVADPLAVDDDYTLTIDANNINQLTGVINLQADNDITINRAIATDQAVTLAAGRSININADIDTVAGNGNINLLANNDDANLNNRQTGAANIQMLDGTSLKAGSGNITLQLGNLGAVGNISLANLVSTGTVTIDGNRGNILPTSANSLITANNLSLNTGNNAGIGLIDTPLKIEVNNLEAIAGSKGIFINATKPLNIGSIDGTNLGLKTEKKGNINLTVTGDLTLTDHVTTATDDQTAAGNISLTSTGNINGTTSLISTNSFDGTAGNIKLTATGDINTAKIQANAGQVNFIDEDYSSEGGSGKAGNITLQAGGAIKTNDISAYAVLGNSGTINLTAEQAITITKLQNFAGYNSINTGESVGQGDSGKINLTSTNGGISTGKIESFAGSGSPGNLIINADNNIAIAGIDSFTNGDGNGALINITSKNGAINIKNPLELSVVAGLGSTVNMTANKNITITGINANSDDNAGNLRVTSNQGAININGDLNFYSYSNGGQVLLKANQDIKTAGINTKSQDNGNAGSIQLISETGNIITTGKLDAIAKGIGGNVDLQAKGNINISGINTSGINTIGDTASGNINITSESGMVNTTQGFLNSYSEAGTPGDITIKASGDITTGYLTALSLAADKGGIVNITSNTGKIDTTQGTIETWSKAGTGNQVTLQAAGNINLGNIDSHGLRGGGAVNITSQQGAVTMNLADTTINSSATQGIPGNVNITGNSLVTVRAINAGGKNILGDVNLTSETNDVIFDLNDITGNLIVNTPNGNIDLTGPQNIKIVDGGNGDPFTTRPVKNINSDADQINNKPAKKVNLQAHNDITLNEAIKTNQQIKELNMQAGRNIKVNADIDTSAGNGNINLLANQADQNNIYRQTGAGNIIMADGTTLKAGKGNINLALGGTEQIGNITLANLQTAGNIQVNALGGNIFASSNNAVINGNQLTLQTAGVGGIGKIDLPLRLQVNVLEANAGSRGVFLKSLQGLTIGSDNLPLSGITTSGGQIQVIAEQGDILIQEPLTTAGDNQNAGNITLKSLAGNISSVADINSQAISTQEANSTNTRSAIINAGDVTLEAAGNITTSNIISSATGNNNSGDISLTAGQSIDTILGKLSAESVDGLAGKINLTAFGDINTGEIFSQATGLGSGGNILINSTNGNVQTNGQISSKTLSGKESGDITISADGDLSIQEKVYSLSEGTGQAGDINIISKQGTITSEQSIES
ncbi:MAG: beta strand repeat-containing protein, partial [Microcoleaceae cyanobacterium]